MSLSRRLLAWSPGLLILILFGLVLIGPYWTGLNAKRQKLTQLQRYHAESEKLLQQNSAGAATAEQSDLFFISASHAAAVAALSERIKQAAANADCQIQSLEPAVQDADNPGVVKVQVNFSAATEPLQKLVHNLESGRPILRLQDMHINVSYQYQAAGNLGPEAGALEVRLTVEGFWHRRGAS